METNTAISLDEVLAAGKKGNEESVMGNYRKALRGILEQVADPKNKERVTIVNGTMPAMAVGKVVNTLKRLFPADWKDQAKYNRSYRYMKGFSDGGALQKMGWEILDVDGHKHLVLTNADAFKGAKEITIPAKGKGKDIKNAGPEADPEVASAADLG
jgi:hypothetical protein